MRRLPVYLLLDTSGSMERPVLAKALGAIASYSISRDVPFVRVVFCDAFPYDQGYMSPEAIAHRVVQVDQLKRFAEAGYRFSPEASSADRWVFRRDKTG